MAELGVLACASPDDNSRQFYHPAVLFFKTKVIGIELQSFAKTIAINSVISQITL